MRRNQPLPEGLYCPNWECSLFGQVEACKLERHAYYAIRIGKSSIFAEPAERRFQKHEEPFSLVCTRLVRRF